MVPHPSICLGKKIRLELSLSYLFLSLPTCDQFHQHYQTVLKRKPATPLHPSGYKPSLAIILSCPLMPLPTSTLALPQSVLWSSQNVFLKRISFFTVPFRLMASHCHWNKIPKSSLCLYEPTPAPSPHSRCSNYTTLSTPKTHWTHSQIKTFALAVISAWK